MNIITTIESQKVPKGVSSRPPWRSLILVDSSDGECNDGIIGGGLVI
jgi:hypothetical protein